MKMSYKYSVKFVPVTGEYFDEDSVWSHHKIKEDLKNWTKK